MGQIMNMEYVRANDRLHAGEVSLGPEALAPILGTWYNADTTTGEISKVILYEDEGRFLIHAFGACAPDLCDWGAVVATPFVSSLTDHVVTGFEAYYDFGFMETHMATNVKRGILVIQSYNRFKDDSGRASYFTREFFHLDIQHYQPPPPPLPEGDGADLAYMMASDRSSGRADTDVAVDLSPFLGTWKNTDDTTGTIQHFTLTRRGETYFLHAFGADAPTDWGAVPVIPCADLVDLTSGRGFYAHYDFGFLDMHLACNDNHGIIIIASYNIFKDGSRRANYFNRQFFYREEASEAQR